MHNGQEPKATVERTLIEAIASKQMAAGVYNGSAILLAPHQLFARHGDLFVLALNTERTPREDSERRLGQFKLAGLSEVALTQETFEPLESFDPGPVRLGDEQLFSI